MENVFLFGKEGGADSLDSVMTFFKFSLYFIQFENKTLFLYYSHLNYCIF